MITGNKRITLHLSLKQSKSCIGKSTTIEKIKTTVVSSILPSHISNTPSRSFVKFKLVSYFSLLKKPLKQRIKPTDKPPQNIIAPIAAPANHIGAPQEATIKNAIPNNIVFIDFIDQPPL